MSNTYKTTGNAYYEAIQNGHTKELQDKVCKDPVLAYYYAIDVVGADIGYCQEMACKDPQFAYCFALNVEGADLGYCQEMACKDPTLAYCFARDVVGADLEVCLEAVRGTEWENKLRKMVVERGIG